MPLVALHGSHLVAASDLFVRVDLIEVRKEPLDRIGERHRVGVEDHDVLGARVHDLQRLAQRAALESQPAVAVPDLETRPVHPALKQLHRFVGGVVDHHHLVFRVVELVETGEQALDDSLLVVGRDVDRHERVVAEIDVVAVAIAVARAVDPAQAGDMPIRLRVSAAVAVAVAAACQQGAEQDDGRAQVVLDRVREEDCAQE